MTANWTAEDASQKLTDPIYVGMGPYPAIVEEKLWLASNVIKIEREGAEAVAESVLTQFRETLSVLLHPDAVPYVHQARNNPQSALRRLLIDLRELVAAR